MATQAANEIERQFSRLSPEAQLSLLERLVHCARLSISGQQSNWDTELSAMAADSDVQRELSHIAVEFEATESDGLGRD
jgi:hypothetical protein